MGETGDESYADTISEVPETDLQFFLHLIQPLILKLPHARDRAQAAAWAVKIVHDGWATDKVKTEYLKLLLMSLQRKRFVGIFTLDPHDFYELEGFPDNLDLHDYARKILDQDIRERKEKIKRQVQGKIKIPPYYTDYSIDLREYVALQDIPGFGVHCYYAISKDPLERWQKSQNAIIPKNTNDALDTLESPKRTSHSYLEYLNCACDQLCEMAGKRTKIKKRLKKWGLRPPIHPIGIFPPKDERRPPAWGSNLIHIFEEPASEPETEEEILSLTTELKKLHQFLEEYEAGILKADGIKTPAMNSSAIKEVSQYKGATVERFIDENDVEEESSRLAEIGENCLLADYLKQKVRDMAVQHRIINRNKEVQASTPAQAHIPMSTPKQAPLPMRRTAGMVSEACGTEVPSRSVSSYFNNEVESAKIDEELVKWVQRLDKLEEECAELARQTCPNSSIKRNGSSCGESSRK